MPSPRWQPWPASLAVGLAGVLALGACSGVTEAPVARRDTIPRADVPYLGSPLTGYPLEVSPSEERQLGVAHRTLLGGDGRGARALALELLGANDGLHPALVILAQHDYLDREYEAARERLSPVLSELPDYSSAHLIHARVQEELGDLLSAYASYRQSEDRFSIAGRRAGELERRAIEIGSNRLRDSLDRGRLDDAAATLAELERWAPDDVAVLSAAADVARARQDPQAELAAARGLSAHFPNEREYAERRAELELDVGSPGEGLRILQDLAAVHPDDGELADKVARARFRWRLVLLPEGIGERAASPELNRGDFASLLYWLFPSVRYGRAPQGRIANDVFDHPSREEIVRVVNMGLMEVDPALHRFEPERPLSRRTALVAYLRILGQQEPRLACLGEGLSLERPVLDQVCQASARCRLTEEPDECLPEAGLSGASAVEMSRRTLEQLGIE